MAEIDDFTVFLVGGLMILAILLAVFSFSPEPQPGKRVTGLAFREAPFFNISTAVHVGPQHFSAIRTFAFSFEPSNLRESQSIHLGNHTIKNGVLFGENDIKHRLAVANPSKLDISFKVVKSNELEPLVIQINGKTVASRVYEPGEYEVQVSNELLSEDTLISLTAASSGWQIWAPNLYELQDVRLDVEGYEEKAFNYVFELGDEARAFTFGKIDLALQKNIGLLNMTLNFNRIYSAPPATAVAVQFKKSDVRTGENILNIAAGKDSDFRGTGVLTIYYLRERAAELRTPLNLTKLEFDQMNQTVVRFNIVNVARPGGLAIRIENRNGVTFRDFAAVNSDIAFEFVLNRANLIAGLNVLTISSIDSAIFDVTDFDVKLS